MTFLSLFLSLHIFCLNTKCIFSQDDAYEMPAIWLSPPPPLRVPALIQPHLPYTFTTNNNNNNNESSSNIPRNPRQTSNDIMPGVYSCGMQGADTFVNFVNPHFPDSDRVAGTCGFRLLLSRPEVCQIRVDFVDTSMLSPTDGVCADQYLEVEGSFWPHGMGRLCGINPDQHFYIHLDRRVNDNMMEDFVDFMLTTTKGTKPWKFGLWISQIDCDSQSLIQAPAGCTQFFMGMDGVVKTFNFEGVQYLSQQNYRICLRAERTSCFVSFDTDPNQFSLQLFVSDDNRRFSRSNSRQSNKLPSGRGEDDCGVDYILIPGGRNETTKTGRSYDRFCGGYLNTVSNSEFSTAIYSAVTGPIVWLQFVSGVRTAEALREDDNDRNRPQPFFFFRTGNSGASANRRFSRAGPGMRLRYSQVDSCPNSGESGKKK